MGIDRERAPEEAERIGDLRQEHEAITSRSREFAAGLKAVLEEAHVPRDAFVRWARAFIDLQWKHMQMEEEVFFPTALELLGGRPYQRLPTWRGAELCCHRGGPFARRRLAGR